MPKRPFITVDWSRNMLGGPRANWPGYVHVLGLIGAGLLISLGFLLLAVLVSAWFWIGFGAFTLYGIVVVVWWRRNRGMR